jgi:hypothetical protein
MIVPKPNTVYTSQDQEFVVKAVYTPNEEHDPWIEYANSLTLETYTCRLEAFLARFRPLTI